MGRGLVLIYLPFAIRKCYWGNVLISVRKYAINVYMFISASAKFIDIRKQ